jgi:hypothetical protein
MAIKGNNKITKTNTPKKEKEREKNAYTVSSVSLPPQQTLHPSREYHRHRSETGDVASPHRFSSLVSFYVLVI